MVHFPDIKLNMQGGHSSDVMMSIGLTILANVFNESYALKNSHVISGVRLDDVISAL